MKAFALLACVLCCAQTNLASPLALAATCDLEGDVSGKLTVKQFGGSLTVEGTLEKIPVGIHAIHVHEKGNLGNKCLDTGGHYNPLKVDHGGKDDDVRHAGDWGNFDAPEETYKLKITDHIAKLDGPHSILGRAIVIHGGKDDLGRGGNDASRANGNAGARIACCVIKKE